MIRRKLSSLSPLVKRLFPLSVWHSVIATVIAAALIALGATIFGVWPFENDSRETTVTTGSGEAQPRPVPGGVPERAWHRGGTPTFANTNGSVAGPTIPFQAWVKLSCKIKDTNVASASPDGFWYRIKSPPWSDRYYAIANTFLNGDPPAGPYTRNTDFSVPDC